MQLQLTSFTSIEDASSASDTNTMAHTNYTPGIHCATTYNNRSVKDIFAVTQNHSQSGKIYDVISHSSMADNNNTPGNLSAKTSKVSLEEWTINNPEVQNHTPHETGCIADDIGAMSNYYSVADINSIAATANRAMDNVLAVKNENQTAVWQVVKSDTQEPVWQVVKSENQEPVCEAVMSENQEPVCQEVKSENQEPVCEVVMSENHEPVCQEVKSENQEPVCEVVMSENQEPDCQGVKSENQEPVCEVVMSENQEPFCQGVKSENQEPVWEAVMSENQQPVCLELKHENQEPVMQEVKCENQEPVLQTSTPSTHDKHLLDTTNEISDDEEMPKGAEIRNNKNQLIGIKTTGSMPHICSTCRQGFRTLIALRVHVCNHQDYPGYICDVCDRIFANQIPFRTHITKCVRKVTKPGEEILNDRNQVIGKKLSRLWDWCVVCKKSYRNIHAHAWTHERHNEHMCEVCGQCFRYRKSLTNHVNMHNAEYQCGECGRSFADAGKLSVHRSSHEAQRRQKGEIDSKHVCDECGRSFRDADKLAVHRQGHQGVKRRRDEYMCLDCDQTFRYRMNFEKHLSLSLPNHVNRDSVEGTRRFLDAGKLAVHRREKWRCKGNMGILHSKKLHSSVDLKNGGQSLAGVMRGQSLAGDIRGQSLARDMRGQSLAGDIPGQSLAGDIPGQSLARDIPGQSLARDIPGQSLARDIPGQSLAGDIRGQSLARDIPGQSLARDIPGQSLAGDIPGQSLAGDIPGQSLARDIPGQSLAGDIRGQSLAGDIPGQSLARDIPGQSLAGDIRGQSLAGDIPGQSLARDIPGQSLAGDIPGQSLARDIPGQSLAGDIPGQSLAGDIRGQSLAGDIRGQSLAGDIPGQSLARDIPGQSLAGDIPGQSLARDIPGQSLAGDIPGQSLAGDIPGQSLAGFIPGQSLAGDIPGQSLARDIPGQSLAGEMPTDEGTPMVNFSFTPSTVRGHIHTGEVKLENQELVQQSSILVQESIRLTAITDITHLTPQHCLTVKCENQNPVWPNVKFEYQEPVQEALIVVKEPDWHFDNKLQSYESVTGFAWDSVLEDCVAHNEHLLNTTNQCSDDEEIPKGEEIRNNEDQVIGVKTSGNTPYMCNCKRGFESLTGLHIHQIVHQEHPVYVCDVCNRNYRSKLKWRTHVTSHCGKPFCCTLCGTRFATDRILKGHVRKCGHESKKPGEDILNDRNQVIGKKICGLWDWCIVCKTRVRHHLIQAHSKTHEYVCKICGKSFKHKSNFTNHVNSHRPEAKRLEPPTRGPKGERRIQGEIDIPCLDIIQID